MHDIDYATTPDDVQLAYQVVGEGEDVLLVVPGFVSHLELAWDVPGYAAFFERLARGRRVVLFDKRGTGLSDRRRSASLDAQAADVETVLRAVGAEEAALFGWSEGAAICLVLGATHPERIDRILVHGGTARLVAGPGYDAGLPLDVMEAAVAAARDHWGRPDDPMVAMAVGQDADQATRTAAGRVLRAAASRDEAVQYLRRMMESDVLDVLPSVRVPTLVTHRTADGIVPIAAGRHLAEQVPDARFVELPGSAHFPWLDDGEGLADLYEEFLSGTTAPRPADRVLATVLFSDIVGSTEQAARLGDRRWRDVLEAHDGVIRRVAEAHGGRFVKSTGDGCCLTFPMPGQGVRTARAIVQALGDHDLRVRTGLHTGEIERRGDDIAGLAVHLAARIADLGGAGETLVSSTVRDLTAGNGFRWEDRGRTSFKGFEDDWQVWALT